MAMRIFMSGKIRETFQRMDGSVLERQKELGGADEYEGCIVERHELLAARKRWSDALSEEDRRRGSNHVG